MVLGKLHNCLLSNHHHLLSLQLTDKGEMNMALSMFFFSLTKTVAKVSWRSARH